MENFPFTSRYLSLPEGGIHYVDEGHGEVILFSHGTPEWVFAYRHLILELSKSYRCIALDHLGFGLSDKPVQADYSIPQQARRFERVVAELGLQNICLVANDFGVAIALAYAIGHPDQVRKICVSNGWMWSLKNDPHFSRPAKLLRGSLGELLYLRFNFAVNVMMPTGYVDRKRLSKEIHNMYRQPLKRRSDRVATLAYARQILEASDWWQQLWANMPTIANHPFLIVWGMKDPFIRHDALERWRSVLKDAHVTELHKCGHFPHEEQPEEFLKSLLAFLKND